MAIDISEIFKSGDDFTIKPPKLIKGEIDYSILDLGRYRGAFTVPLSDGYNLNDAMSNNSYLQYRNNNNLILWSVTTDAGNVNAYKWFGPPLVINQDIYIFQAKNNTANSGEIWKISLANGEVVVLQTGVLILALDTAPKFASLIDGKAYFTCGYNVIIYNILTDSIEYRTSPIYGSFFLTDTIEIGNITKDGNTLRIEVGYEEKILDFNDSSFRFAGVEVNESTNHSKLIETESNHLILGGNKGAIRLDKVDFIRYIQESLKYLKGASFA